MSTDVISYILLMTTGARLLVDRIPWPIAYRRLVLFAVLIVCGLPIVNSENLVPLALVMLALPLFDFLILWRSGKSELRKAWAITAYLAITLVAFTTVPLSEGFNATVQKIADIAFQKSTLGSVVKGRPLHNACLYISGMLLASFELHHLIVWVISRLKITPRSTKAEIARGKAIGYLERPIVFFLIITGNFVSLGLVFAAKTLTRFGKLNDRAFAEYYLLGTLLSFGTTALLAALFSLMKIA